MANKKKIVVIDTSVLLHDHQAITTFGTDDVALPITVLFNWTWLASPLNLLKVFGLKSS